MIRLKVFLHRLCIIQFLQGVATKMYPVNTPRMVFTAAISMLCILWQYKKFIRAYFVPLPCYLVPAMPIYTLKQKIFCQSFFSIGVMIFCFRIISDAADMQMLQQWIAQYPRFQNRFRYFNPLPAGAVPDIFMRAFLVLFFFLFHIYKLCDWKGKLVKIGEFGGKRNNTNYWVNSSATIVACCIAFFIVPFAISILRHFLKVVKNFLHYFPVNMPYSRVSQYAHLC